MTVRSLLLGFLLTTSLLPLPAHADGFVITDESVREILEEILPVVRKKTGWNPEPPPSVRVTDSAELRKILLEEFIPQQEAIFEDKDVARVQAETLSQALSEGLLAKYVTAKKEIVVLPSVFETMAERLELPAFTGRSVVRAVLVHELIHARDHDVHDWPAKLQELRNADALLAYNAVIEGSAQHAARAICFEAGWSKGFETFTDSIGRIPLDESAGEGMRQLQRVFSANLTCAYSEGEEFMRSVDKARGAEGLAKAFRDPPADLETVFHPEWFLDPESRPEFAYDLTHAVKIVLDGFDEADWTLQEAKPSRAQLEAAFALLPSEEVAKLLDALRQVQSGVAVKKSPPGSQMVACVFYEFGQAAEANNFCAASERLVRLKDEQMKSGAIQIASASYNAVKGKDWNGLYFEKKVLYAGQELLVASLIAVRGRVGAEILFSNKPTGRDELVGLTDRCFDGVLQVRGD